MASLSRNTLSGLYPCNKQNIYIKLSLKVPKTLFLLRIINLKPHYLGKFPHIEGKNNSPSPPPPRTHSQNNSLKKTHPLETHPSITHILRMHPLR
jgi:hypothetical protein